jgi:uncharacterized protein (UPF0216 family)
MKFSNGDQVTINRKKFSKDDFANMDESLVDYIYAHNKKILTIVEIDTNHSDGIRIRTKYGNEVISPEFFYESELIKVAGDWDV